MLDHVKPELARDRSVMSTPATVVSQTFVWSRGWWGRLPFAAWLLVGVITMAGVAHGTSKKPVSRTSSSPASGVCLKLQNDITSSSKSLAVNFAEGIGDNSAPRATMRETQNQTILTNVRMTMDLMRDNRCKLPTSVPTGGEYIMEALQCKTDRLEAEGHGPATEPASCEQSKWVPK